MQHLAGRVKSYAKLSPGACYATKGMRSALSSKVIQPMAISIGSPVVEGPRLTCLIISSSPFVSSKGDSSRRDKFANDSWSG
jgi:hypothetical protein